MTRPLVIAHGNVYAANKTLRRAKRELRADRPDSIGVNEGWRVGGFKGYRKTVADAPGRKARSTPLYVKGSHEPMGAGAFLISHAVPGDRLAHERWATVAMYRHPIGDVAHINVHLNAAVRGHRHATANQRVREYVRSVDNLGRLLRLCQSQGYLTIVSGDVNMRPEDQQPWGPRWVLQDHGMRWAWRGLDVIAWDARQLRPAERLDIVPRGATGSDHPFLVATLERHA